jgi:hypothetical protein
MAKDTAQYIELGEIIYQYMDQSKMTASEYRRLWPIAVRGVEELGLDVYAVPKTEKLLVNANKTVTLPSDYIAFSKVGVLNAYGEVATLRKNKELTAYRIEYSDRTSKNTDDSVGNTYRLQDLAYVNYFDGARYVNIFGAGAALNSPGEFDVDEDLGILYLDNDFNYDYVILEYFSSPSDDPNYKVPIQIRDALISYIAWKDIEYLPSGRKVTMGDKQMRRKEYYNQKRLARMRVNPVTPWDANELIRLSQKLVAKA